MLPCTGRMWTWPSLGLCSAIRLSTGLAERDEGTVRLFTLVAPFNVARYSGYSVFTPPRVGAAGIQSAALSHSPSAVFCPGRKWGTQCRFVPPFSAKADALQVSIAVVAVGSIVYVVDSTYGSSM